MALSRAIFTAARTAPLARLQAASARALSGSAAQERPFRVLGLQQIAVGNTDKKAMQDLWIGCFGLKQVGTFKSERENVDEDILQLGASGPFAVEVDIMTPIDANKSPKVHDPALNHVGLWIDKLPEAVEWLQKQGVRFTPGGIRKGASGFDVTFIHPKGSAAAGAPIGGAGVLIELVQAPPTVIAAFDAAEKAAADAGK